MPPLSPDVKRAIRRRFTSGRYSKEYLAGMYKITVEEVAEALTGARRDKLTAILRISRKGVSRGTTGVS